MIFQLPRLYNNVCDKDAMIEPVYLTAKKGTTNFPPFTCKRWKIFFYRKISWHTVKGEKGSQSDEKGSHHKSIFESAPLANDKRFVLPGVCHSDNRDSISSLVAYGLFSRHVFSVPTGILVCRSNGFSAPVSMASHYQRFQ